MLNYEYRVIEAIDDPGHNGRVEIWRSIGYSTRDEAATKLRTLTPKENGILEIKKEIVRPF